MLTSVSPALAALNPGAGSDLLFEELAHRDRASRRRVGELEAANESLQRQVELEARRLQTIMRELVLAAERAGTQPLARAMRAVACWQSDLSSVIDNRPRAEQSGEPVRPRAPVQRLSAREDEVLRLLASGDRSPCIATRLGISASTVEVHRRNIMRKLGLHCVVDLTKYAVRQGLTSL